MLAKRRRKVAAIAKAAFFGHKLNGLIARFEQQAGLVQTFMQVVGLGRAPQHLLEAANESRGSHMCHFGKLAVRELLAEVGVHGSQHPNDALIRYGFPPHTVWKLKEYAADDLREKQYLPPAITI